MKELETLLKEYYLELKEQYNTLSASEKNDVFNSVFSYQAKSALQNRKETPISSYQIKPYCFPHKFATIQILIYFTSKHIRIFFYSLIDLEQYVEDLLVDSNFMKLVFASFAATEFFEFGKFS